MPPTRDEYIYRFDFDVHDGRAYVALRTGGHEIKHRLESSGLMFQTLLALSWYVETTPDEHLDDRLLLLLGRHLYRLLFGAPGDPETGQLAARFVDRCHSSTPVRISLGFSAAARRYAQLPWEFLALPDRDSEDEADTYRHLADIAKDVTLTRHTGLDLRLRRLPELRVLVATHADPSHAAITTNELQRALDEMKETSSARLDFRFLHNDAATLEGIATALREYRPHVFHFSGHGERAGLWLAQSLRAAYGRLEQTRKPLGFGVDLDDDAAKSVQATIKGVLSLFDEHQPELVILDACSSDWSWLSELLPDVAHQLVTRVPAVVAMRYPIRNTSAERFAVTLYEKIAAGEPLDDAVHAARHALTGLTTQDSARAFGTPVLYLRDSESLCGTATDVAGSSAQRPSPCPRCHNDEQWNGGRRKWCTNCFVPFRCGNDRCESYGEDGEKTGYDAKDIREFAGECAWCDWVPARTPNPIGRPTPSLSQAHAAMADTFGSV